MPKQFVTPTYTFTPGASGVGTLDLSGVAAFDIRRLVAVINQTRGVVIYATGSAATRYTAIAGSVLTLNVDTATHNAADVLQVIYDQADDTLVAINAQLDGNTGELTQAVEALRMAVQSLNRSIGLATVDTTGRTRVVVDSISGGLSLATVATVTNVAQAGTLAANDQIPALMHLQADSLRNNITVT
jgi:hypothetical protein